MTPETQVVYHTNEKRLICSGDWNLSHLLQLRTSLEKITKPHQGEIIINGDAIATMDSAGAYLLIQWIASLEQSGVQYTLQHFSQAHEKLLRFIIQTSSKEKKLKPPEKITFVEMVGQQTIEQLNEFHTYLTFIGQWTIELLYLFYKKGRIRYDEIAGVIYRNGYQALPIIALLSMMVGVVIAYQMGVQLRTYGANIFIVDFLGLSVLREFGPLLTAIMVAGRTGSAFTAQLGLMKINQEIDALDTMGVTPADILILPRIIGLFIALPLLTIWADIFGVLGGMMMATTMLNLTWYDCIHRFAHVIPLRALLIGFGKAPVFALIIASVGCFQGMTVQDSASSVGRNTTRSVVLAIFFIIVVDAIFSVIFSEMKL